MATFPPIPRSLGTPVFLLNQTSISITLTAAVNAGDTVTLLWGTTATGQQPISPFTDSFGNVYISRNWADVGMPVLQALICPSAVAMPIGTVITLPCAGAATGRKFLAAIAVEQLQGTVDADNQTNNGTATSAASIATGTLAQPNELLWAFAGWNTDPAAVTHGGSWIELFNVLGTQRFSFAYQNVAALTSVAYAPTWINSVVYRDRLYSTPYGWSGETLGRIGGCGNPTGAGCRYDNQCFPF